jgi:hypothetical protein
MTRWRAVLAGFALAAASETLAFLVTGRVTLVGGLAGSAFAGYVAGPDPADGAWHGLLSSLSWGTLLIPGLVVLAVTGDGALPFPFEFLAPLFTTPGAATTGVLLSVTLPNAAAGAAGSRIRRADPGRSGRESAVADGGSSDGERGESRAAGGDVAWLGSEANER